MDLIAPLAKTGVISETLNLWLAVPIGFVFGFALVQAGFTDSRIIARTFYLKAVRVPVVMFTAIGTGMLGLWLLGLMGVIDTSKVYFLPTFLIPMAVGGVLFGIGMAIGGFCPGTAAAALATGKVDGVVFVVGFLIGSLLFGDLFPVWGDFYNSDYYGVFRLDELFGVSLGVVILLVTLVSIGAALLMRFLQRRIWSPPAEQLTAPEDVVKHELPWVGLGLVLAVVAAFFSTQSFLTEEEPEYYLIPKVRTQGAMEQGVGVLQIAAPTGSTGSVVP